MISNTSLGVLIAFYGLEHWSRGSVGRIKMHRLSMGA